MKTESEVQELYDRISSDGTLNPERAWVVTIALAWVLDRTPIELLLKRIGKRND